MPLYTELPTINQWLKETSMPNARKGDDLVLTQIDFLINEINSNPTGYDPLYLYGELYYATDNWLKVYKLNPQVPTIKGSAPQSRTPKELETVIKNLFAFVAKYLAACLNNCTINALPNWLEILYGTSLTTDGRQKDGITKEGIVRKGQYMQRSAANEFRVVFVKGVAWQFKYEPGWWKKKRPLERAHSDQWYDLTDDKGFAMTKDGKPAYKTDGTRVVVLDPQWANFVMSMSRDIYMGPHMIPDGTMYDKPSEEYRLHKVPRFHSSWLGGTLVQCAGSLLVEDGIVKGIRNNSGHYQPANNYLENVVDLLRTVGQEIKNIQVFDYKGNFLGRGDEARVGAAWALQKAA